MNTLNRGIVFLVALATMAGSALILLAATKTLTPTDFAWGWVTPLLEDIADADGTAKASIVAGAIAVTAVMIALMGLEVVPYHRRRVHLPINSTEELFNPAASGKVTITHDSVCDLAEAIGHGHIVCLE